MPLSGELVSHLEYTRGSHDEFSEHTREVFLKLLNTEEEKSSPALLSMHAGRVQVHDV